MKLFLYIVGCVIADKITIVFYQNDNCDPGPSPEKTTTIVNVKLDKSMSRIGNDDDIEKSACDHTKKLGRPVEFGKWQSAQILSSINDYDIITFANSAVKHNLFGCSSNIFQVQDVAMGFIARKTGCLKYDGMHLLNGHPEDKDHRWTHVGWYRYPGSKSWTSKPEFLMGYFADSCPVTDPLCEVN